MTEDLSKEHQSAVSCLQESWNERFSEESERWKSCFGEIELKVATEKAALNKELLDTKASLEAKLGEARRLERNHCEKLKLCEDTVRLKESELDHKSALFGRLRDLAKTCQSGMEKTVMRERVTQPQPSTLYNTALSPCSTLPPTPHGHKYMPLLRMTININPPKEGESIGFTLTAENAVHSVDYAGPARVAGIMKGDVLTSVMGRSVSGASNAGKLLLASSIESARQLGIQVPLGLKRQASSANEMTLGGVTGATH